MKEMRKERMRNEAWALVDGELARDDSALRKKISDYLSLAEDLYKAGRLKESKEMYQTIANMSGSLYRQAEKYVDECSLHEDALEEKISKASLAYSEGRLEESKKMWEEIKSESVPRPLSFEF